MKKKVIDFNRLPKQEYQKPSMKVIKIQQSQMLCSSPGAKSVSNTEGIGWQNDGFSDKEVDY